MKLPKDWPVWILGGAVGIYLLHSESKKAYWGGFTRDLYVAEEAGGGTGKTHAEFGGFYNRDNYVEGAGGRYALGYQGKAMRDQGVTPGSAQPFQCIGCVPTADKMGYDCISCSPSAQVSAPIITSDTSGGERQHGGQHQGGKQGGRQGGGGGRQGGGGGGPGGGHQGGGGPGGRQGGGGPGGGGRGPGGGGGGPGGMMPGGGPGGPGGGPGGGSRGGGGGGQNWQRGGQGPGGGFPGGGPGGPGFQPGGYGCWCDDADGNYYQCSCQGGGGGGGPGGGMNMNQMGPGGPGGMRQRGGGRGGGMRQGGPGGMMGPGQGGGGGGCSQCGGFADDFYPDCPSCGFASSSDQKKKSQQHPDIPSNRQMQDWVNQQKLPGVRQGDKLKIDYTPTGRHQGDVDITDLTSHPSHRRTTGGPSRSQLEQLYQEYLMMMMMQGGGMPMDTGGGMAPVGPGMMPGGPGGGGGMMPGGGGDTGYGGLGGDYGGSGGGMGPEDY